MFEKSILLTILLNVMVFPVYSQEVGSASAVSIYGVTDVGVAVADNSGGHVGTLLNSGGLQGSRLGFRGQEDVGGGLKAFFALEAGIDMDQGTTQGTAFFNRQSFVGLQSATYGSLTLGRQYTPSYDFLVTVGLAVNLGSVASAHDGIPGYVQGQPPTAAGRFNNGLGANRASNSVKYLSPELNGLSFSAMYAFGEVAGSSSAGRILGIAVRYQNEKDFLSFAYNETASASNQNLPVNKIYLVGGRYNFSMLYVNAYYTSQKNSGNVPGMNADVMSVMLSYPVENLVMTVGYSHMNDKTKNNWDSDQYAIGTVYFLSKRTSLYSTLGYMSVKNGGVAGQFFAKSDNGKQTQVAFGVRHVF